MLHRVNIPARGANLPSTQYVVNPAITFPNRPLSASRNRCGGSDLSKLRHAAAIPEEEIEEGQGCTRSDLPPPGLTERLVAPDRVSTAAAPPPPSPAPRRTR